MEISKKKRINAALTSLIVYGIIKKRERKRKCWSRKWLLRRTQLGCYENLMRELALEDAEGYRRFLRMDTESFEILLQKVEPLITRDNTRMRKAIPAAERLAITLRYLATGETQSSIAFNFRVAQNTISGIIPSVCAALVEAMQEEFMKMPDSPEEWQQVATDFYALWQFPHCIGALDGKHISISPPPNSGSAYYNYKHFFSIVLLALVDANLMFLYVDVGTNGRVSDAGVWDKCKLKRVMESNTLHLPQPQVLPNTNVVVPHVIVADDAFPLGINMLKPYPGKSLVEKHRLFNYRLSRARRVSENAFGILASRFRIFQTKMLAHPARATKVVMAACVLHNFLRKRCSLLYTPISSLDREDIDEGTYFPGSWRETSNLYVNLRRNPAHGTALAKEVRNRYMEYFNGPGAVPWQRAMCDLH